MTLTTHFHLNVDNENDGDYVNMKNHLRVNDNVGDDGGRTEITENNYLCTGGAIAQVVSRWLPTAAARVRVRAAYGVCGGQSGTGADFLRVLRFPPPIILPISPSS
jgi:hypothetical protein